MNSDGANQGAVLVCQDLDLDTQQQAAKASPRPSFSNFA